MAENRRGKDKRYYLSRGQFVLLGCGFTAASVIIFFLGMLVGQGIEERKIVKPPEPLMKIPVKPTDGNNAAPAPVREEITFYDTLTQAATSQPRIDEVPGEVARTEKTFKSQPKTSAPAIKDDPAPPNRRPDEKRAAEKKSKTGENIEAARGDRPWTVQVNAFPDEKAARTWVDRLKDKGYNAYLTEAQNQGKHWYRVRVGRFSSREEAEKVEEALRKKENLVKSFATSR
jgi:DedD protein